MTDKNTRRDQASLAPQTSLATTGSDTLEGRGNGGGNGGSGQARNAPVYRPDVDIYENDRELLLVADLPGVRAEAIDVRYEDGTLTLTAHVEPREPSGRRHLLREYGVGDFQRSFRVDERIDATGIAGEYLDGVLTLRLPKVEAARPTKVQIRGA